MRKQTQLLGIRSRSFNQTFLKEETMKTVKLIVLVFVSLLATLTVIAVLPLSSPALANSDQQTERNQTAKIAVTEKGFEPSTITLKPNVPAQLTFVRQTDKTCATAVAIPEYKINRDLPLNKPVVVEFTPRKTGEFAFACGMNMLKGKLVVAEKDKK